MSNSFRETFDEYVEQEGLYRTEGRKGVENLCTIARALGYKDSTYFGQFSPNASFGDFIEFLGDNPGCVAAIHGWIMDQHSPEWQENLESALYDEELEEDTEE